MSRLRLAVLWLVVMLVAWAAQKIEPDQRLEKTVSRAGPPQAVWVQEADRGLGRYRWPDEAEEELGPEILLDQRAVLTELAARAEWLRLNIADVAAEAGVQNAKGEAINLHTRLTALCTSEDVADREDLKEICAEAIHDLMDARDQLPEVMT